MQWFQRFVLISILFSMVYFKRTVQSEEKDVNDDIVNDEEIKENFTAKDKLQNNSTKESNTKLRLEAYEPGFDFTEGEMIKFKLWPKGIIPYLLDDYSFDNGIQARLRLILNDYNSITGLAFTEMTGPPKDDNVRWVLFINRRGVLDCQDYTTKSFTYKGVQRVVVGYDCLGAGGSALAGTVLALAGVPPQHNAPDRDQHIDVIMDNIIPEKRDLFQVLNNDEWLFHDIEYDFLSATHYDSHKYTNNGSATIVPKSKLHYRIGEGDGISPKDILKIKLLYNYISRNRRKANASDCSRIFKPGANFINFKPVQESHIIPKEKPSMYLGVSKDKLNNRNGYKKEEDLAYYVDEDASKEQEKKNIKKREKYDSSEQNNRQKVSDSLSTIANQEVKNNQELTDKTTSETVNTSWNLTAFSERPKTLLHNHGKKTKNPPNLGASIYEKSDYDTDESPKKLKN